MLLWQCRNYLMENENVKSSYFWINLMGSSAASSLGLLREKRNSPLLVSPSSGYCCDELRFKKKKKKSLKSEGKVWRLFSGKQIFLKWGRHRRNHGGCRREATQRTKVPPLLPVWLVEPPAQACSCPLSGPGHTLSHWAAMLTTGKDMARIVQLWNVAFCTIHNNRCTKKYRLTDLMEPSWFYKVLFLLFRQLPTQGPGTRSEMPG